MEHIGIIGCNSSLSIGSTTAYRSSRIEPERASAKAITTEENITNVAMKDIAYTGNDRTLPFAQETGAMCRLTFAKNEICSDKIQIDTRNPVELQR